MEDGDYTMSLTHDTHNDKIITFSIDNDLPEGLVLEVVMEP